jgi:hypothetical protein
MKALARVPSGAAGRCLLALASGYGAYPAGRLGDALDERLPLPLANWSAVLIGALFAALVLWPQLRASSGRTVRAAALVAASVAIYALTVRLAVSGYGPLQLGGTRAVALSGVLGAALVTAAVGALAPLPVTARIWVYALGAGLLGGVSFDALLNATLAPEALLIGSGYAAWQLLVCLALELGARRQGAGPAVQPRPR